MADEPIAAQSEKNGISEMLMPEWQHLVKSEHPWRRQLYIKGRNMTARQLVGGIRANGFTEEEAALNYDLPIEVIREAQQYVDQNCELLRIESDIEGLMLQRGGVARGPRPVSG